jgi:hypothetical protein
MSIQVPEPTVTGPNSAGSYSDGLLDGELAAVTGLSSRRVHARASMADQYDVLYAQGLIDGYLHAIQVNAARVEKEQGQ